MNKIISFAFLAIFAFYGFRRCSKPHPGDSRDRGPASSSEPASTPSSGPAPASNPGPDQEPVEPETAVH